MKNLSARAPSYTLASSHLQSRRTNPWPNLAGQKNACMVKQMKAFKDGTRADPLMSPMAAPLTDADMENLAACYSSLKQERPA